MDKPAHYRPIADHLPADQGKGAFTVDCFDGWHCASVRTSKLAHAIAAMDAFALAFANDPHASFRIWEDQDGALPKIIKQWQRPARHVETAGQIVASLFRRAIDSGARVAIIGDSRAVTFNA